MATALTMPLSFCCRPLVREVLMFRAITHAFTRRKSGHSPAAPTPVLAEQRPVSTSTPTPVHSLVYLRYNGVLFPVVWTIADFVTATASKNLVMLRLRTEQYASHMHDIMRHFDSKYDPSSPEYLAFKNTRLLCAGCGWQFPQSYTLSLIGALDGCSVVGAIPGYAEFAKTGTCTKCGSADSHLAYQCYDPSSISQADVDAIRQYWRHRSEQWWSNTGKSTAICDGCNNYISQAGTYLIGGHLECERCTDEQLADGLNKLRRNPHYFGATELQVARTFANL